MLHATGGGGIGFLSREIVVHSIVVVRFAGGDVLSAALTALRQQSGDHAGLEVIVAQEAGLPGEWGSDVSVVELPAGAGPARLRAAGVHAARGDIVTVTEDHCVARADWCMAVRAAHEAGHDVVGGPIDPASSLRGADLALYLLAYAHFRSPRPAGTVTRLSDCNVSYRRGALDLVRETWREAFVESDVHAALVAAGQSLWFEPRAGVLQGRTVDLAAVAREQRVHGEEFASGRAARASRPARLVLVLTTALLPPLMLWRALRQARGLGVGRALSAVPPLTRLAVAWAQGEFAGYARSLGR